MRAESPTVLPTNTATTSSTLSPTSAQGVTRADDDALPSVAIVITCYNHGRFLADAIRSAQRQTHPAAQIIVIDDGSRDNSAAVAAQFDVHYHYQANAGPSAARNTAIDLVGTEFITFLDADDVLHPNALEDGARSLQRHPNCGFTFGRYRVQHPNGSVTYIEDPPPSGSDGYSSMLTVNFIGSHCAVMYRVEALREIGGFDPTLRACEDHDVYLRILQTRPYCHHQGIVTDYIHHGSNTTRDFVALTSWSLKLIEGQRAYAEQLPNATQVLKAAYRQGPAWWARLAIEDVRRDVLARRNPRRGVRQAVRLVRLYPHAVKLAAQRPFVGPPPDQFESRRAHRRPSWLRRTLLGTRTAPIWRADEPIVTHYERRFAERHASDQLEPLLELGTGHNLPTLTADPPRRTVVQVRPRRYARLLAERRRFADASQRCVVCLLPAGVLQVDEIESLLLQIRRILQPGGVALLTFALPQLLATGARTRMANDLRTAVTRTFPGEIATVDLRIEGNHITHPAAMAGQRAYRLDDASFDLQTVGFELIVTARVHRHEINDMPYAAASSHDHDPAWQAGTEAGADAGTNAEGML